MHYSSPTSHVHRCLVLFGTRCCPTSEPPSAACLPPGGASSPLTCSTRSSGVWRRLGRQLRPSSSQPSRRWCCNSSLCRWCRCPVATTHQRPQSSRCHQGQQPPCLGGSGVRSKWYPCLPRRSCPSQPAQCRFNTSPCNSPSRFHTHCLCSSPSPCQSRCRRSRRLQRIPLGSSSRSRSK